MERMYQVLFTEEEYRTLLGMCKCFGVFESCVGNSIDRYSQDGWEDQRICYNTVVALRRAEQLEVDIDLYEH
jgi:hypothetical protein